MEWCMRPDVGLPEPDKVIYLSCSQVEASQRGDYGTERYENTEFQERVKSIFLQMKNDAYWEVLTRLLSTL
jgi:dTMP kinase